MGLAQFRFRLEDDMSLVGVGSNPGEEGTSVLVCTNCEEEIPHCDATSWGRSSWSCKKCKSNYNRQSERNRKSVAVKKWWVAMESQARKEWFIEHKSLNPDKWASKVTCRQSTIDRKADEDSKHDVNDNITKETFVLEQMHMGLMRPDAETKWDELIADDTVAKEWHAGTRQYFLAKFRGTRATTGTRTSKVQQWSRDRDIEDGQDFNEAEDARKDSCRIKCIVV